MRGFHIPSKIPPTNAPEPKKKFYQTDLISCSGEVFQSHQRYQSNNRHDKESDEYFSDHHPFQTTIATDCLKAFLHIPEYIIGCFSFCFSGLGINTNMSVVQAMAAPATSSNITTLIFVLTINAAPSTGPQILHKACIV